ncbi:hypothetical protein ACWCQL_30075 [Streptomyces sp. NPDC002073]
MTQVDPRVDAAAAHVYKMRDLSLRTSEVIREINASGQPALITLRGRFVAMITPLANSDLQERLISTALEAGSAETPTGSD